MKGLRFNVEFQGGNRVLISFNMILTSFLWGMGEGESYHLCERRSLVKFRRRIRR